MKERLLNIDGLRSRICIWGEDKNETIICFHGLGGTAGGFMEVAEGLQEEYRVIGIDFPGFGKSDSFENISDYEIPNLCRWINQIFVNEKFGKTHIMAHSWGACVALHFAKRYPECVNKLLLLDGGYHVKDFEYEYASNNKIGFTSIEEEIQYYYKDFDQYIFDTWEEAMEEEKNLYLRWSEKIEEQSKDLFKIENGKYKFIPSGKIAEGAIWSMYKHPTDEVYGEIDKAIKLLVAKIPEEAMGYREIESKKMKAASGCEMEFVNTTHMVHWDNPELVIEEAKKWF